MFPGVFIVLRPPNFLVTAGAVAPGTLWKVKKAIYGLRESPLCWQLHRDDELRKVRIDIAGVMHKLEMLKSDPGVWKLVPCSKKEGQPASEEKASEEKALEEKASEEKPVKTGPAAIAFLITYVDDLLMFGSLEVVTAVAKAVKAIWKVSDPEVLILDDG
jgi:hypothetical protein